MVRLSGYRELFVIVILLSWIVPSHSSSNCYENSTQENAVQTWSPVDGIIVYYVSYLWCIDNCQGDNPQIPADFILILLGFALPAVIFSTVIPRRWRLDLPERVFKIGRNRLLTVLKLCISLPAIVIVAGLDMISWITCIMTFAGPMAFGGVQEMLLDFRVVMFLKRSSDIPARLRLEAVVALLCGNFDQDVDDPMIRINDSFIPSEFTEASLDSLKSRLINIMNAQTSFGTTIGIPAVFFVGGFLYNTSQSSPPGTISFGIFWMVLVLVAIISGTLLAGNSPHAVSIVAVNRIGKRRTRLGLLNDMYDSDLYPVPMWDRGFSKYQWLQNTALWKESLDAEDSPFKKSIEIGRWSWGAIAVTTWLLVATPCFLSWSFDYLVPFPWLGCLSLLYGIYLTTQTWLVLVALVLANRNMPFHNVWQPFYSIWERKPRSVFLRFCTLVFTTLTGLLTLIAGLLTVIGSVFQFSGRYETCFCATPVSYWLDPPAERRSIMSQEYTSQIYEHFVNNLIWGLSWAAAFFTCFICFLGWWYQRSLRGSFREVIESIQP